MTALQILVAEYPGDEGWDAFAAALGANTTEIASVASLLMGPNAAGWLAAKIPALDGHSANEVLELSPEGLKAVRSLLMRLP